MPSGPGTVKATSPHETSFHSLRRTSMTKLRRSMTICFLFFGVLVFAASSWAQTRPPEVEQLAKTYGLDSYGQIEAVRYTFNLDLPALKVNLSRTWTWEPKTGQVCYHPGGPKKPRLLPATWAGYKKAGPLLVSTDHRGTADGKPARIFFTNVAVKLVGSDKWMDAQ